MKVAIANDHGGLKLKKAIKLFLEEKGISVVDLGSNNDASVDYPKYAQEVGKQVQNGEVDRGILCCGTGIGMSIAANKMPGIRAAVVSDVFSAKATKEHNDTNVLCLGERVIGEGLALLIVDTWIEATFLEGRHAKRVAQYENN